MVHFGPRGRPGVKVKKNFFIYKIIRKNGEITKVYIKRVATVFKFLPLQIVQRIKGRPRVATTAALRHPLLHTINTEKFSK